MQDTAVGSSPRMRGTPSLRLKNVDSAGIIPAYAGNTQTLFRRRGDHEDHPRVCGEHSRFSVVSVISWGSSPRMRGTPGSIRRLSKVTGIIPAYAGNTAPDGRTWSMPGDHPRVCGEHATTAYAATHDLGSSPRMRGTLEIGKLIQARGGIIPAYAGNTTS